MLLETEVIHTNSSKEFKRSLKCSLGCNVEDSRYGRWDVARGWDSSLYFSKEDRFDIDGFKTDVVSLCVERELGVTGRRLVLRDGRLWNINGRLEIELLEESIRVYGDMERFKVEMIGWRSLELMMERKKDSGGWFIIASPPGDDYRKDGVPALSASFLFRLHKDGVVEVYSIYQKEIDPLEHWRAIIATVPMSDKFDLDDPMDIVKMPVFVGGDDEINIVLSRLGIDGGIDEVVSMAEMLHDRWFNDDGRYVLASALAEKVRMWKRYNMLEVVDEIIERATASWAYGKLLDLVDYPEQLSRWLDLQGVQVLRDMGKMIESWLFAYEIGLTQEEWNSWSNMWVDMLSDPAFLESYLMSIHGGGIGLGGSVFAVTGAFDVRRVDVGIESGTNEITCPHCSHKFHVDNGGKCVCPRCGKEIGD